MDFRIADTFTDALARLASLGLAAEGGVDALLEETPTTRRGERLRLAVTEWLDSELHGLPGRPAMLEEYLEQGWPVRIMWLKRTLCLRERAG